MKLAKQIKSLVEPLGLKAEAPSPKQKHPPQAFIPGLKPRGLLRRGLKAIIPSQVFWIPRYYHLFYRRLNFKNRGLILDAGCGEGIVTTYLAKRKLKIVGMDRSFKQIKEGQKNCDKNIFIVGDLNSLPFKQNSFDLIFSLDALEWSHDLRNVFQAFYYVLKPRGKLIISVTRDYTCSAKLFTLQRILRKLTPPFLYARDSPAGRSWLNFTDKDMAKKMGHVRTYCLNDLIEKSKGLFKVCYCRYYIKVFTALVYDIVYGIKGFYYFRFLLFFIAVRVDHRFFKKMPGYSLFVEFIKNENSQYIKH